MAIRPSKYLEEFERYKFQKEDYFIKRSIESLNSVELGSKALEELGYLNKTSYGLLDQNLLAYIPPTLIPMNTKTYLAVSAGIVVASDENLDVIKKKAAELTYKSKSSVIIFQPILEVSPKYETVETTITMK